MNRIALTMLFGRPIRYAAMVFATSFAVLLITQQASVFLGVMVRTTGPLQNIGDVDIWVTSRYTEIVDIVRNISKKNIARIETIHGVAWAKPFLLVDAIAEAPDGSFHQMRIIGIDRSTLIGQPPTMLEGDIGDLRSPDSVLLESSSRSKLPAVGVGDLLRLNDQRARVVGVCRARTNLVSQPILFTTYQNASQFSRRTNETSWILVKLQPGTDAHAVCREIQDRWHLDAFPADDLRWESMKFVMIKTAVGASFLFSVILGFVVGLIVSAATFNQFTTDCLPYFAVLKAIGTSTAVLTRMIVVQALSVGLIGYGIGVGMAALLSLPGRAPDADLTTYFPWQLMLAALVPMTVCMCLGSFLSLLRVIRLDPVVVFQ